MVVGVVMLQMSGTNEGNKEVFFKLNFVRLLCSGEERSYSKQQIHSTVKSNHELFVRVQHGCRGGASECASVLTVALLLSPHISQHTPLFIPQRSTKPIQLYQALDERDRHIEDLEAELERETQAVQEGKNGLSSDLEQHRDDLIKCHDAISELQIQIKQLTSENDGLLDEKLQLEDQVSAHKSLLDAQRTKLAQHTRLSDSFKKQQKDGNQQLQRLELENQR